MNKTALTERWEYILGGFTYIDQNHEVDTPDTAVLAKGELCSYIKALTDDHSLIELLGLDVEAVPFSELPHSFEVMLNCDNNYLKTAPETPLNAEFGSVSMALLYRDVAISCHCESILHEAMLTSIAAVTGKQPIID